MNNGDKNDGIGNNDATPAGETKPLIDRAEEPPSAMFNAADIYEQQRRSRLCLALALFSFALTLVAALAIWKVHLSAEYLAEEQDTARAAHALAHLNARSAKRNVTAGCETTLVIIRHCEKHGPDVEDAEGNQHCSYIGYERAQYIASLFGNTDAERWPMPHHLFALTPDRVSHLNFREYETLLPLSRKAAVMTELVRRTDFSKRYFDLMMEKEGNRLCGKTVVVSFKHEYIPGLTIELGCGVESGCPGTWDELEFDQVWLLKYVFHENSVSDEIDENSLDFDAGEEEQDIAVAAGDIGQRRLKKKHHKGRHKNLDERSGWNVYATTTKQNFDPLAFSKQCGDYPEKGTLAGANWDKFDRREL